MILRQANRPPTLLSVVINDIREAILTGGLKPGAHLNEVELSKSMKVARGTLREAFRALQKESLVSIVPHRGCFVTKLNKKKAKEIYTLRSLIESYAIRVAMEKGAYTDEVLKKYKLLVIEMGNLEKKGNLSELIELDMKFHMCLVSRSDHSLIIDIIKELQGQIKLFINNTKYYQSDNISDEYSHREILNTIQLGDPVKAEAIIKKHIINAGESLIIKMD